MSDKTEKLPEENKDAEFADVDESMTDSAMGDSAMGDSVSESISVEQPKAKRALLPLLTALLSLIVATLALAGVGWLAMTRQPAAEPYVQDTSAIDTLAAQVAAAERSMTQLGDRLEALGNRDVVSSRELADIQRQMERRVQLYDSLPGRMDNVEDTMTAIQGISTGVRDTWLLAEAEYYMQMANAQLQLAGNPHLARLALLQADQRIRKLANPALTNIRQTLASELQVLDSMNRSDIEGITLALASLADVVVSLPIRSDVTPTAAGLEEYDEDLSGYDRAVESLRSTMSGVVSVRRTDENIRPLIAPESAYFLRANLMLQLQTARLALLRSEKAVFQQSLDDAASWLVEFYDPDSAQVQVAQKTISEIRESMIDIETPDISESLRQLRQFAALAASANNETATNPIPETPVEVSNPEGEPEVGPDQ